MMKEKLRPDVEAIVKAAIAVADDMPIYYDDAGMFHCAFCDGVGTDSWIRSIRHDPECTLHALQQAIGVYDRRDN